jgi:hypothetical protein
VKKTILTIVCCGCDTIMGEKNGGGVKGQTSTLCPECEFIERLKLAQNLVKTKKLSWVEARKQAGLKEAHDEKNARI